MKFLFIDRRHPLYETELDLRFRVLRRPLGMTRAQVTFPFEEESWHLVAVGARRAKAAPPPQPIAGGSEPSEGSELGEGDHLLGCVLFHPDGASTSAGRLYQMAVEPAVQRQGIGSRLVQALETEARRRGYRRIFLHARREAIAFYQRLEYVLSGDPFDEVGIPHRVMVKPLGSGAPGA